MVCEKGDIMKEIFYFSSSTDAKTMNGYVPLGLKVAEEIICKQGNMFQFLKITTGTLCKVIFL